MKRQITTLSENTALVFPRGLLGEWGLSILLEVDGRRLLLDAGAGVSAGRNGDLLGIDWPQIDAIVLSHGHYDHTGGLRGVLKRIRKQIKVIAHPDVWDKKYLQMTKDQRPTYVGIPFQKAELESLGAEFQLTKEPVWLSDHVVTSGEIPMTTGYEVIDPGLYVKRDGALLPDPLADDQALFIKTEQGLTAVLGCAHRGVINTLRHAQKVVGAVSIHTVVGGTHLIRAPEVQLEQTIAGLKDLGVQRLGVAHCTGMPATLRLAREFGQSFFFSNTGTTVAL